MFIDADKPNYLTYLHKVLDGNLLSKGGVIAVDNVAYRGAPWAPVPDGWYDKSGIRTDEFKQAVRSSRELDRAISEFNDTVRYAGDVHKRNRLSDVYCTETTQHWRW